MNNVDMPAHPTKIKVGERRSTSHTGIIEVDDVVESFPGLSKREAFVKAAMQGLCASGKFNNSTHDWAMLNESAMMIAAGQLDLLDLLNNSD